MNSKEKIAAMICGTVAFIAFLICIVIVIQIGAQ